MYDTSTNFLTVHEWAYGLTDVTHILSMALGVGLSALVDLRLLGAGLAGATPERRSSKRGWRSRRWRWIPPPTPLRP